jgi:hypothetical protein
MRQFVLSTFRWTYSSWLIAIAVGAWWLMIQLHHFSASYVFVVISGALAIGSWLTSKTLSKNRRVISQLEKKAWQDLKNCDAARIHQRAVDRYLLQKSIGIGVLVVVTVLFLIYVRYEQLQFELSLLYGKLYPANESSPPVPPNCKQTGDKLAIYAGKMLVLVPFRIMPVNLIHARDQLVLRLDRNADTSLVLSGVIRDATGKVIIQFDGDGFTVNPNNYLKFKRTDRSTLVVVDQLGNETINVKYVNLNTLLLKLHFYFSGQLMEFKDGMHPVGESSGIVATGGCMTFEASGTDNDLFTIK